MNNNDIPPVPQFLLRNADRHDGADDLPDAGRNVHSDEGATEPPPLDLSAIDLLAESPEQAPCGPSYSTTDLSLFKALTGYSLDIRTSMPRAIDDSGMRARIADRLFTTLAEEAFGLADRQRRTGACPDCDLTVEDLAVTLGPIRRAAAAIGSRGLIAFETLEVAVGRLRATVLAGTILSDGEGVAA